MYIAWDIIITHPQQEQVAVSKQFAKVVSLMVVSFVGLGTFSGKQVAVSKQFTKVSCLMIVSFLGLGTFSGKC